MSALTLDLENPTFASGALFSDCLRFRYRLWRRWRNGDRGCVNFIMLNPSTADAVSNDPTVRRCIGFARSWGYDGLTVTNLFAFRSTDPAQLETAADPIGPDNDINIRSVALTAPLVVCAWGVGGRLLDRSDAAFRLLRDLPLHHLSKTGGPRPQPKHPLYLRRELAPVRWEGIEVAA